ncbi:hypothetical protein GW932_00075 [archaeon]|nr:hypothetical protein [archaeon]
MTKGVKHKGDTEEVTTITKKVIKKTPKKNNSKRRITRPKRTVKEDRSLEKILIENFISMQKVMTNMAEKFDHLTKQISDLLTLFDESAKVLTEKEINLEMKGGEKEKEVLDKLNAVLEQNKLIAKGLTLMHETAITPNSYYSLAPPEQRRPIQQKMPQRPQPMNQPMQMESSRVTEEEELNSPELNPSFKKPQVIEEPFQSPDFSFKQNA